MRVVWVAVATVEGMADLTAHRCVFFDDDGWLEPVCACGRRAIALADLADVATDGVVVLLGADEGDSAVGWALDAHVPLDELAISA